MRVVFRVDASLEIGAGHVMRCLTLAEALRERGSDCRFICRSHPGNLTEEVRQRGFKVVELPLHRNSAVGDLSNPKHANWLGEDWQTDAEQTKASIGEMAADWLVVDHYALDARWEHALAQYYCKLMVIDDLADRAHACDLLLDQTVGRDAADYLALVPAGCRVLCGARYALLRPEFSAMRKYSLRRRARPVLRELLVTMGGVDKDDASGQVLQALRTSFLPADCRITVVMGATAPWLDEVHLQAQAMPWPTRVLVGVSGMAQLMADSDLAIGAAGATSWERCCLGLPTILLVLAENQRKIADGLRRAGAAHLIDLSKPTKKPLIAAEHMNPQVLGEMSAAAAAITDGFGITQIIETLICEIENAD